MRENLKTTQQTSQRALLSQRHSPQYPQFNLHLPLINETTFLSINTILAWSNHYLKVICYQVSLDQFALACMCLLQLINECLIYRLGIMYLRGLFPKQAYARGSTFTEEWHVCKKLSVLRCIKLSSELL